METRKMSELTPEERQAVVEEACRQLERELRANGPAIAAILGLKAHEWEDGIHQGDPTDMRCVWCRRPRISNEDTSCSGPTLTVRRPGIDYDEGGEG